jgi:hypothetical protein
MELRRMPLPLLTSLPDDLTSWEGNIHELAAKCDELRPAMGLADDTIVPNERLLRHYLQAGILTAPTARQGREAVFGGGHVVEYLVARYLISKEGWRLSNVADINRESDWHAQFARMVGLSENAAALSSVARHAVSDELMASYEKDAEAESPTPAEAAVRRIRAKSAPEDEASRVYRSMVAPSLVIDPSAAAAPTYVQRAAAISVRRVELRDALITLGNPTGEPERHRMIRLRLTPWCDVQIDAAMLDRLDEETTRLLGQALTHALQEERLKNKGNKP